MMYIAFWAEMLVGCLIVFAAIYGAYYLLGRNTCAQSQILRASALVMAVALVCAVLAEWIEGIPDGIVAPVSLVMAQMYGKMLLGFSTGRAWAAVGLFVLFQLMLFIPLLFAMFGSILP